MAVSNIASSINSKLRMSGMSSGLDTDGIIKQLMAAERAKVDKLKQKRELSVWKTDAYREVTSTLKSFYSDYFDPISPKNIKSTNAFSTFSSTLVDSTKSEYVNVSAGAGATAGAYTITDIKTATVASIDNDVQVSKIASTGLISDADVAKISSADYTNKFVFTFNNKTVDLDLKDGMTTVAQLRQEIQDKIDGAFGSGKVTVTNNSGKLEFTCKSTDSFSIGTANNNGAGALFSAKPAVTPFTLNAGNNMFEFTIDGQTKTITVPPVDRNGNATTVFTDPLDLAAAIQKGVENQFGTSTGVTFEVKDGIVVAKVPNGHSTSVAYSKSYLTNDLLHIDYSRISNKVDLAADLSTVIPGFNTAIPTGNITGVISGDTEHDIEFTINGKSFKFNSAQDSLKDIMSKVNSDVSLNVSMKYDLTTNSFSIATRDTGVTKTLDIQDKTGSIMTILGLTGTASGSDAHLKLDGMEEIIRPTNSFTYAGITFDLKKDYSSATNPPIAVKVASDTSKTYDYIKGFVDKYNELIGKLNSELGEKRYRDYLPLTEDQKSAMSEDQIKKWETYAKSGLLKDDSIISGTLSKFRTALYDSVEGVGIDLPSIGITTSSDYLDKGKLVIDETKLKNALENKPEEVMNLFTKSSDTSYYNAINGSSADLSKRYKESGLAQRMSDVIQDAVRTSMDKNGQKGSLLEKAGMVGDRSEFTSLLYKEIDSFDKAVVEMNARLTDKENALYTKFSALETAMNKMNSQSSWLAQQFGGGNQ